MLTYATLCEHLLYMYVLLSWKLFCICYCTCAGLMAHFNFTGWLSEFKVCSRM